MLTLLYFLNALLMIGLGLGLGAWLTRRFRLGWRLYWIGAATFLLSQVGHIPFNAFLLTPRLPQGGGTLALAAASIALGLSAGLWEEGLRYLVLRLWAKDARSWRTALLFGAGHGGLEAILLGGLAFYAFLQLYALQGADLSRFAQGAQLEMLQAVLANYWSAPWHQTLLGAVERALALCLHLACAVLVMRGLRSVGWLIAAILLHAMMDASAVFVAGQTQNAYWAEAVVGGWALFSLLIIWRLRRELEPPAGEAAPHEAAPAAAPALSADQIQPVDDTPENLDQSRYTL